MSSRQPSQRKINLTKLLSSDLPITVANHRVLCKLLGEPVPKGTSQKKLQLNNWKRFFKSEKVEGSNKIVITEIYKEAKPIEPPKYNQIYLEDLVLILLTHCANNRHSYVSDDEPFYFTKTELLIILGLCNISYLEYRSDNASLYYEISGEEEPTGGRFNLDLKMIGSTLFEEIKSFYSESGRKHSDLLRRLNKAVQTRNLLLVEETFQAHETDGKWIQDISPEQKATFTKIYDDVLLKYKCKSVGAVFHMGAGRV